MHMYKHKNAHMHRKERELRSTNSSANWISKLSLLNPKALVKTNQIINSNLPNNFSLPHIYARRDEYLILISIYEP